MPSIDVFNQRDITSSRGRFSSPWSDIAQQYAPRTFLDALKLSEFLYVNNATYRKASERIVSYFITNIKLSGQSDGELQKFRPVLENKFNVLEHLNNIGCDYMAVGNSISQIIPSFLRILKCTNCKTNGLDTCVNILKADFEFKVDDLSFYNKCNKCGKRSRHMVHDYPDLNPENIKLVRRDPKSITIEFNQERGIANYWMDIDPTVANKIKGGDRYMVSTTPWSIIQAISKNQKYKLNPEYTYHLKENSIAGLRLHGWGLPSILSSFKDFFRIQMLRRYDETLMMDYIVPMRIISPRGGAAGNSIMEMANMDTFKQNVQGAIMNHRIDGADWNIFPFPIEYQPVGGEGRNLSPREQIADEEDRLLNSRGIPAQLYRGDLTFQTAPAALRVFEKSHQALVHGLNSATQWMVTSLSRIMKSGNIDASLASVTLVDDLQKESLRMQLMQASIISKETGLDSMNINMKAERQRIIEERKQEQRDNTKAEQEMQMEQMNLNTPEADAQGSGGDQSQSSSPMDVQAQGEAMAQQLLDPNLPETSRRQQLSAIRSNNPTLHAVVIKEMEKLRNQAGTAGYQAALPGVIAQNQQNAANAAPAPTPDSAQKTASALVEPNLKNSDLLVDSALDFSKVAGAFPTSIYLTRADEFGLIKWGSQQLGLNLDQFGDIRRNGTLKGSVDQILGMKLIFDAKETLFK